MSPVEQVEEFALELDGEALQSEFFSCIEVYVDVARTHEIISSFITERERSRDSKFQWIEPLLSGFGSVARRIENPLSSLWTSARVRDIPTSHCAEWQPRIVRKDT